MLGCRVTGRMGRRGKVGGVTLYVRERFDCTVLTVSGDVVDVMAGDCTGHSDDKRVELKIFSEIKIEDSEAATLAFRRTSFELFREIFSKVFSLFKAGQSLRTIFYKLRGRQFQCVLSQESSAEDLPGESSPADKDLGGLVRSEERR